MAPKVYIPEQETFEIGGRNFTVTMYPTMFGLNIQTRMANGTTPELLRDMVVKSVSVDSVMIDEKKFDQVFAGKYKELIQLVDHICEFNFGKIDDSEGTDSPKEEGTGE